MGTATCRSIWTGDCNRTNYGFEFVFGTVESDSSESTELFMVSTKTNDADYAYLIFALAV
jgi:hypothetical protein